MSEETVIVEEGVAGKVLSHFQYNLLVFGLPLLMLASAGGMFFYTKKLIADELASRPPIAVLPVRDSVLRIAKDSKDPERLEDAISQVNKAGKSLKDAGYLVLDADYVYAYPGEVEANP